MIFRYLPKFKKQFAKLTPKLQMQFGERVKLFQTDPTNIQLRIHPLKGQFAGYWSMNISGDLRALYYYEGDEVILFALIGTHSQLY